MTLAVIGLAVALLTAPLGAGAQAASKVSRIGFLAQGSAANHAYMISALKTGLQELGYREGIDVVFESRYADGEAERLPRLALDLVRLKIDVLVVHGGAALEAKKATSTVPVVFVANPNPVELGLVASLGRPGGNLTGLSDLHGALVSKRLEALKEVVPSVSRIAVLFEPRPDHALQLKDLRASAPALGLSILAVEANGADGVDRALTAIGRERAGAVVVLGSPLFGTQRRRIAAFSSSGCQPSRRRAPSSRMACSCRTAQTSPSSTGARRRTSTRS